MSARPTSRKIVRRGMAVFAYTAVLIALAAALLTRGSDGAPPPTHQVGVPRHPARAVIKKPGKPRPPVRHHPHRAIVPPPPPVALHIDHQGAGHGTVAVLGGARCTGDCTIGITRGRVLTLTAETVTGSRFAGWAAPAACRGSRAAETRVAQA